MDKNRWPEPVFLPDRARGSHLKQGDNADPNFEKNCLKLVKQILIEDKQLLFDDSDNHEYKFERLWATNSIDDSQQGRIDLPGNVRIYTADVWHIPKETRRDYLRPKEFMLHNRVLIPLGTHVFAHEREAVVYHLDKNGSKIEKRQPLQEFVLEQLPDTVTLTRVLSAAEAKKFANTDESVGSRHSVLWEEGRIHTAIHNISSEFLNSNRYRRAVKFKMPKSVLRSLVKDNLATIGSYNFLFKDRAADSPLPFEAEVIFKKEALTKLRGAYHAWSKEIGHASIRNPFFGYKKK